MRKPAAGETQLQGTLLRIDCDAKGIVFVVQTDSGLLKLRTASFDDIELTTYDPKVGGAIGWVTGVSRVESLGAAANIFVGQSESPLVVRPYIAALTPARLFTVMTVGMPGAAAR